jgi:hypothetical protein
MRAYALRQHPDDNDMGILPIALPGEAPWDRILKVAEGVAGSLGITLDIFHVDDQAWHLEDMSRYIVTICGGSPYWSPPGEGTLHQIGSPGHCWDCFHAGHGFVRHPITPGEVLTGSLSAISTRFEGGCTACGGGYTRPAMMPATIERDNEPLDGGQYAITYVSHSSRCAALHAGPEHEAMGARAFCAGCAGTCCTGDPAAGPCTCTEEDRMKSLRLRV